MGDETKIEMRQVKEGVGAAGSIIERYLIRILGPLGRRIAASSPLGRVMAFIGLLTVVVSLILILTNAMWFSTQTRKGHKYVSITYEQKGYGIAFLSGIGLVVAGMLLKEKGKGKGKRK
jgi:hypothetical protein